MCVCGINLINCHLTVCKITAGSLVLMSHILSTDYAMPVFCYNYHPHLYVACWCFRVQWQWAHRSPLWLVGEKYRTELRPSAKSQLQQQWVFLTQQPQETAMSSFCHGTADYGKDATISLLLELFSNSISPTYWMRKSQMGLRPGLVWGHMSNLFIVW